LIDDKDLGRETGERHSTERERRSTSREDIDRRRKKKVRLWGKESGHPQRRNQGGRKE